MTDVILEMTWMRFLMTEEEIFFNIKYRKKQ